MIDIVTVVFQEEIEILKLQAQSINLYCQEITISNIYVVVNDDSLDIDPSWWGIFSDRVRILPRSTWENNYVNNGWLTQQLLKLLAASTSTSEWSMILDAKTILIQPIKLDKLFDNLGRLTWGYYPIVSVFDCSKQLVSKLFNINLVDVAGPAGVPFFFHNNTVREMIADVEHRTKQKFGSWFQNQGMITEFILYSGYLQYRDGSLEKTYTKNSPNRYTVCNVCHSEINLVDSKILEMFHPKNLTVSVHRNAWKQLSPTQKKLYRDFLIIRGITRAKDLI